MEYHSNIVHKPVILMCVLMLSVWTLILIYTASDRSISDASDYLETHFKVPKEPVVPYKRWQHENVPEEESIEPVTLTMEEIRERIKNLMNKLDQLNQEEIKEVKDMIKRKEKIVEKRMGALKKEEDAGMDKGSGSADELSGNGMNDSQALLRLSASLENVQREKFRIDRNKQEKLLADDMMARRSEGKKNSLVGVIEGMRNKDKGDGMSEGGKEAIDGDDSDSSVESGISSSKDVVSSSVEVEEDRGIISGSEDAVSGSTNEDIINSSNSQNGIHSNDNQDGRRKDNSTDTMIETNEKSNKDSQASGSSGEFVGAAGETNTIPESPINTGLVTKRPQFSTSNDIKVNDLEAKQIESPLRQMFRKRHSKLEAEGKKESKETDDVFSKKKTSEEVSPVQKSHSHPGLEKTEVIDNRNKEEAIEREDTKSKDLKVNHKSDLGKHHDVQLRRKDSRKGKLLGLRAQKYKRGKRIMKKKMNKNKRKNII